MAGDSGPERTPDGRHIVVDGRRWRASDPSIPDALRAELVAELMAARRAVAVARRAADDAALRAARTRVGHAKTALGERGRPWWEPSTDDQLTPRIEATVRTLLQHRGAGSSICPSDVARAVGGPDWRARMGRVREVARAMALASEVTITARGERLDPTGELSGPVRLHLGQPGGS